MSGRTIATNNNRVHTKRHIYYMTRFNDEVYGYGLADPHHDNGLINKKEMIHNILPQNERKNGRTDIHMILTLPNKQGKDPSDLEYHQYTEEFLGKFFKDAKGYYAISKHEGDKHKHVHVIIGPEKTTTGRHRYSYGVLKYEVAKFRKDYSKEHGFDEPQIKKAKQFTMNYKALEEKQDGLTLKNYEKYLYDYKNDPEKLLIEFDTTKLKLKFEELKKIGMDMKGYDNKVLQCKKHIDFYEEFEKALRKKKEKVLEFGKRFEEVSTSSKQSERDFWLER